jgi:hypothetical protein
MNVYYIYCVLFSMNDVTPGLTSVFVNGVELPLGGMSGAGGDASGSFNLFRWLQQLQDETSVLERLADTGIGAEAISSIVEMSSAQVIK